MNSVSSEELRARLSRLERELMSAREAFEKVWLSASGLMREIGNLRPGETGRNPLFPKEQRAFDAALEEAFQNDHQGLVEPFSGAICEAVPMDGWGSRGAPDHYVESPFVDPFDCFDEAAPEDPFPFKNLELAPLEGLFNSSPGFRRSTVARDEVIEPELEIEFTEEGGYRMRSRPRKNLVDPFDGLES